MLKFMLLFSLVLSFSTKATEGLNPVSVVSVDIVMRSEAEKATAAKGTVVKSFTLKPANSLSFLTQQKAPAQSILRIEQPGKNSSFDIFADAANQSQLKLIQQALEKGLIQKIEIEKPDFKVRLLGNRQSVEYSRISFELIDGSRGHLSYASRNADRERKYENNTIKTYPSRKRILYELEDLRKKESERASLSAKKKRRMAWDDFTRGAPKPIEMAMKDLLESLELQEARRTEYLPEIELTGEHGDNNARPKFQ